MGFSVNCPDRGTNPELERVRQYSAKHCAMSPALSECQCGDYGTGLVYQPKPEGRLLTSAIISTPLRSEWPLCIFSHEFIINSVLSHKDLKLWCCVSQKCECGIIHTWSPVGQSQLECENVCSTSIKIIIPRLKVPVFKCCQMKLNTPLNFSDEFYVPDSVPITTLQAPLCFYISYKAIFLYYFNWKIKICLNYDRLCKHFLWLMAIITFVDYANIFVFNWTWKFIRVWSLNMGSPHPSVDADWFYPRIDDKIRGLWVFPPRIALFLSANISRNNVHNITRINLWSRGISAMKWICAI